MINAQDAVEYLRLRLVSKQKLIKKLESPTDIPLFASGIISGLDDAVSECDKLSQDLSILQMKNEAPRAEIPPNNNVIKNSEDRVVEDNRPYVEPAFGTSNDLPY